MKFDDLISAVPQAIANKAPADLRPKVIAFIQAIMAQVQVGSPRRSTAILSARCSIIQNLDLARADAVDRLKGFITGALFIAHMDHTDDELTAAFQSSWTA